MEPSNLSVGEKKILRALLTDMELDMDTNGPAADDYDQSKPNMWDDETAADAEGLAVKLRRDYAL